MPLFSSMTLLPPMNGRGWAKRESASPHSFSSSRPEAILAGHERPRSVDSPRAFATSVA